MKPLVQKMWAVKFVGQDPEFKPILYTNELQALADLDVHIQPYHYRVVSVEVRELEGK